MKYEAVNELTHFDFHDALINRIYFKNDDLIWDVSKINATTENSQNDFEDHMCVEDALMIFENAQIENIFIGGYKRYNSDGVLIDSKENVTLLPEEYEDFLKSKNRENGSYIFGMESFSELENGKYRVKFDSITFTFSKSIIKWENYSGKAWYESDEWKKVRKQREESWEKFKTEYKIGDIIDVKIKDQFIVEIFPGLSELVFTSHLKNLKAGEIRKAKITDINYDTWRISLEVE